MSEPVPSVLAESWLELPDGRMFWLAPRCSIGRQAGNDLVLDVHTVSRQHAVLVASPAGCTLTDLHSSNGSYVNRRPVTRPISLCDGDELRFGDFVVRYRCTRQTPPNAGTTIAERTRRIEDVRERACWLLLADIAGYSALNAELGSKAALARLQAWITGMRPVIERHGGHINSYVGDAIFAWWDSDPAGAKKVVATIAALEAWRAQSPVTFRLVVHHGPVLFTRSERGEELSGQEVNFLFRAEKLAKKFGAATMLSDSAARSLNLLDRCRSLGTAGIDGIAGQCEFFAPR